MTVSLFTTEELAKQGKLSSKKRSNTHDDLDNDEPVKNQVTSDELAQVLFQVEKNRQSKRQLRDKSPNQRPGIKNQTLDADPKSKK